MPRFPHSFHAVTLMTVATSFIVFRGAPAAPPPGSEDLVGTWRLVSYEDWDATGKVSRPYGEHPRGYIIFDSTGHVSVNLMRMPALPPFASKDEKIVTPAEKEAAFAKIFHHYFERLLHLARGRLHPRVQQIDAGVVDRPANRW